MLILSRDTAFPNIHVSPPVTSVSGRRSQIVINDYSVTRFQLRFSLDPPSAYLMRIVDQPSKVLYAVVYYCKLSAEVLRGACVTMARKPDGASQ